MSDVVVSKTFPDSPESASEARHWIEGTVEGSGWAGSVDELALLVSELVTNAVRHADRAVGVTLYLHGTGVWVSVVDDGAGVVQLRHAGYTDVGGRGLEIIDVISESWGVIAERDGKTVWFELPARCEPADGEPVL